MLPDFRFGVGSSCFLGSFGGIEYLSDSLGRLGASCGNSSFGYNAQKKVWIPSVDMLAQVRLSQTSTICG